MDELEFDPTGFTGADTTTEIEGLEDHIELLGEDVPEQDYRTPVEQAAEVEAVPEQEQPAGGETAAATTAVDAQGKPVDYNPALIQREGESLVDYANRTEGIEAPNRFDHVSYNGRIDKQHLLDQGIDEGVINATKATYNLIPKERQMWTNYKENGGDTNLENVRNTFLQIQNDPELLARYDRDGDGIFTVSDWFDTTRHDFSQEEKIARTQEWLEGLENKDLVWRAS